MTEQNHEQPKMQTVTITLPAMWFHALMTELLFGASLHGSMGGHSSKNCETLLNAIAEQVGTTLEMPR